MLWLVKKNQDERKTSLFRGSKSIVLIGLILLAASGAFAEGAGKIIGKVTAKKTGEGLPFSLIAIIGTKISASADLDGSFVIENVPVDTYDLRVKMFGFKDMVKANVRVIQGQTTVQDFALDQAIIPADGPYVKGIHQVIPTGKIVGKVTDAMTGEALPSTSVTLVGTKFSDHANLVGDYYIIKVPPGTYVLSVEMLGYEKPEMIEVRVFQDKTTVKNFKLKIETKYLENIKHPY